MNYTTKLCVKDDTQCLPLHFLLQILMVCCIYIARIRIQTQIVNVWNIVAVLVLSYPNRSGPKYIYSLMNDYGISFVFTSSCCWARVYIRQQRRFHYITERRVYTRR